jgi:hypothetical protein
MRRIVPRRPGANKPSGPARPRLLTSDPDDLERLSSLAPGMGKVIDLRVLAGSR